MTSDALRDALSQMKDDLPEEVRPVVEAALADEAELEAVWTALLAEALRDET